MAQSFDLKHSQLSCVVLSLKSSDLASVMRELDQKFGAKSDGFFDNDPILLDCTGVDLDVSGEEIQSLIKGLRSSRLRPVAFQSDQAEVIDIMTDLGLEKVQADVGVEEHPTVVQPPSFLGALLVDQPLRAGQSVYAKENDLVVLSVVNPGAEVRADGSIFSFAPLRGRAMAGINGNTRARICSVCMDPQLVAIAGVFCPIDNNIEDNVKSKSAQVYLRDDHTLFFEPINYQSFY